MAIRRGSGALLIFAGVASCGPPPIVRPVECVSRFDCAGDEMCSAGSCVPATIDLARGDGRDASIAGGDDAGQVAAMDAAGPPSPSADAGASGPPAGAPPPMDAGVLACSDPPVTVYAAASMTSYCTIVEALAAAPEAARIEIAAGRYAEPVQVVTRGLVIQGLGAVTIAGAGDVPALRLNAENVIVRSIAVEAGGNFGVEITATATLEDMTVTGAMGAGVWVSGTAVVAMTRVTITGVLCGGACAATNYGEGVVAHPGTTVKITDSQIADNDFTGIYSDAAIVRVENTLIRGNGRSKCQQNVDVCMPGIMAGPGSDLMISRMTQIRANGGSGVHVRMAAAMVMVDSESYDNGIRLESYVDGVLLDSTISTLNNNKLDANLGYGIGCLNGSRVMSCGTNNLTGNGQGQTSGTCDGC